MTGRNVIAYVMGALLILATAPYAWGHLSGVFAYFVQDINEPTASTRMLQSQLDSVTARLVELEPQVREARAIYHEQSDELVQRMRFYDVYAGSALGALWAGAQDPIEVLASTTLMQRRLRHDLQQLSGLAEKYRQLTGMDRSLRQFSALLLPFRLASEARDRRLAEAPAGLVSPFAEPYIAYRVAEDWEALRGSTFVLYFNWASRLLADRGLTTVMDVADDQGTYWTLSEETMNVLVGGDGFPFVHDARFYLRADHVYFTAQVMAQSSEYQLLTVGQLERTGPVSVQYRIEAIFLDGLPIDPSDPDVQREVYQGHLLGIDLEPIRPVDASIAAFEQRNGSILFRFQ